MNLTYHGKTCLFSLAFLIILMVSTGAKAIVVTPQIAVGANHTVALKSDGTVVAWGDNSAGQTTIPMGLTGVTAIAAGFAHTVALKSDGTVVAWGDNSAGQTAIPMGLTGVTAIAAGGSHTVALKLDSTVMAWGVNRFGQTIIPIGLSGVTAIDAEAYHSLALKADGTVVAWGFNRQGQITLPVGLTGVIAIAGGDWFSLSLKLNGTVVAWGSNAYGQSAIPAGLTGVTKIAAGGAHTVALKSDGTVMSWGWNGFGQTTVPLGLTGVVAIAAGNSHTVALKSNGTIVAWGDNTYGQTTIPTGLLPSMMKSGAASTATSPSSQNIALKTIQVSAAKPSNVTIQFRAFDATNNLPITNLQQSDFHITQDGYALSAESFVEVKKATELTYQIDTVLMIDISSSINSINLQVMKKAAKAVFLDPYGNNQMLKDQRIAVYVFDDTVKLVQDFTSDPRILNTAIDTIIGRGITTTNMYGAIIQGMSRLKTTSTVTSLTEGKMILITDGRDTAARSTLAQAQMSIGKNCLYVVGVKGVDLTPAAVKNIKVLTSHYTPIGNFSAVEQALRDININIEALANSFYQVLYTTPARAGIHHLSLSVVNNRYTGANAKVTGTFDAIGFIQPSPQVLIQGASIASVGDTVALKAVTRLVAIDPYAYQWVNKSQTLATLLPVDPYQTSTAQFKVNQKGIINITLKDVRYPKNLVHYQLIVDDMSVSHAGMALSSISLNNGTPYRLNALTLKSSSTASYTWSLADPLIAKINYTTGSMIDVTGLATGQTTLMLIDKNNNKTLVIPITVSLPATQPVTIKPIANNNGDTVAPVMTLLGSSVITIVKGSLYNDAGSTAMDNIDGNITANIKVTNLVNTKAINTYTVLYDVQDAAFNAAKQMQRVVHVVALGSAAQRGSAVQVPLSGSAPFVDIYSAGEVVSNFSSVATMGTPPVSVQTPLGVIRYTTTVATVGASQTMNLSFGVPLPTNFKVYKVDKLGAYTLIPQGTGADQWSLVDAFTIALRLTDGGQFDLDSMANGVIVDPLAIGVGGAAPIATKPATAANSTPTAVAAFTPAGGGGGCTIINSSSHIDPTMLLFLLLSVIYLVKQRRWMNA